MNDETFLDLAIPSLGFLLLICIGIFIGVIQIIRQENQFNKKMNHELKNYNSQEVARTRIKFLRVVRQIFNIN